MQQAPGPQRTKTRRLQWIAAGVAVVVVLGLAIWKGTWPFLSHPAGVDKVRSPSVWQYLFGERTTLGFVRIALAAASLFVVASVAALAVAGRWMYRFGGLSADEKDAATERISELEEQLRTTEERLAEEVDARQEAEDWADYLLDQVDEVQIQLDEAREALAAEEDQQG